MKNQIDFLKRLIGSKSTSGKEKEVAELIKAEMKDLDYQSVKSDKYGNLLGTIGSGPPYLMLEGHMDTVEEGSRENWKLDPFSGETRKGNIYGRGSVDMKGPLSSMIYGVSKAKRGVKENGGTVLVACVVHEETMEGAGIEKLIEEYVTPDLVILGEPSGLDICAGHRGRAVTNLSVSGSSSHASMPELGENAALRLIDLINYLKEKDLPEDPKLGKETMALINISCRPGEGPVVPNKATAKLDFRIGRSTSKDKVIKFLENSLEELSLPGEAWISAETLNCFTDEELTSPYYFPAWHLEDEDLLKTVEDALNPIVESEVRTWNFSTDGVYTAGKAGIPTLGFGPGDETLAHQPNEKISIDELKTATECYRSLSKNFTGQIDFKPER